MGSVDSATYTKEIVEDPTNMIWYDFDHTAMKKMYYVEDSPPTIANNLHSRLPSEVLNASLADLYTHLLIKSCDNLLLYVNVYVYTCIYLVHTGTDNQCHIL